MDKKEFQKKYDNSILVCCTEDDIKKSIQYLRFNGLNSL